MIVLQETSIKKSRQYKIDKIKCFSLKNCFQIELVLKFLQKAALSLREPYYLKAPSAKLSGKDRVNIFE